MPDSSGGFRFSEKRDPVEWNEVLDFDVNALLDSDSPSQRDLQDLDNVAKGIITADIVEDKTQDAQGNIEQLLKLVQILQLAYENKVDEFEEADAEAAKLKRQKGTGGNAAMQEELDNVTADLEEAYKTIKDHEAEIDELRTDLRNAEDTGGTGDLRDKMEDLEAKLEEERDTVARLERERRAAEDAVDEEKSRSNKLSKELKEERRRVAEATEKTKNLEDDLIEMRTQLSMEQKRKSNRDTDEKKLAGSLAQRNREISRYQRENKLLERANMELQAKVDQLNEESIQLSDNIVQMDEHSHNWRVQQVELESRVEELDAERTELLSQVEELSGAVEEKVALLDEFEAKFKKLYGEWESRLAAKDGELLQGLEEREKLLVELNRLQQESAGSEGRVSAAVGMLKGMAGVKEDEVLRVREELREARDKEALLAQAYYELERDVGKEVEVALDKQRAKLEAMEADNKRLKQGLEQERSHFDRLDQNLGAVQEELEEANVRLHQYEAGIYGLPEAMKDMKRLKKELKAAEDAQQRAIRKQNEFSQDKEDLYEQNQFLREKCGVAEGEQLQLGDFKVRRQVEAASLRALNAQLEREVAELEEDRRKLKEELRYRARWHGEVAAKLGLTNHQMMLLEDYSDSLRFGEAEEGTEGAAVRRLEEQVKRLQGRLADAVLDQPEAFLPPPQQHPALHPPAPQQLFRASGEAAGAGGESVGELQRQVALLDDAARSARVEAERVQAENRKLSEEVLAALQSIRTVDDRATRTKLQQVLDTLGKALAQHAEGSPLAGVGAGPTLSSPTARDAAAGGASRELRSPTGARPDVTGQLSALTDLAEALAAMRRERDALAAQLQKRGGGGGAGDGAAGAGSLSMTMTMPSFAPISVALPEPSAALAPAVDMSLSQVPTGGALTAAEAVDLSSLQTQLIECLQEQSRKEELLEKQHTELLRQRELLKEAGQHRALLYREHVRLRSDWNQERKKLADSADAARSEAAEAQAQLASLNKLVARLKDGTAAELKQSLVDATNKLTVVQVKEVRLARQLRVSAAAERAHALEKAELAEDLEDLHLAAQARLTAAQREADAAQARADALKAQVDLSVKKEAHESLLQSHRVLQAQHKALMQEKTDAVTKELDAEKAVEEVERAVSERRAATEEAEHLKLKVQALESALQETLVADAPAPGAGRGGEEAEGKDDKDGKEGKEGAKKVVSVMELRSENVALRTEVAGARRQSEYDEKEKKRLHEGKAEIEEQLKLVQKQMSAMSAQLHRAQEAETEQLRRLGAAATLEQYRTSADERAALEQKAVHLQEEAARAQDRARAAESQLHTAVSEGHRRNLELNGLRAALRKMEEASEFKAAMGALHEELLRVRSKELSLKHALARAESGRERAEAQVGRLRARGAEREQAFYSMHGDLRSVLREHEEALQRVERDIRSRIEMSKAQDWSRALLDLRARHKALQHGEQSLREERFELVDRVHAAEARLEHASSQNQVLRGEVTPTQVQEANLELSEKLLQLRMSEAKLSRKAHMLNERVHFLEKVEGEREAETQRVEEECMRRSAEAEQARDDLARRMRALQGELLEVKKTLADARKAEAQGEGPGYGGAPRGGSRRSIDGGVQDRRLARMEAPKLQAQVKMDQEQLLQQLDEIQRLKKEAAEVHQEHQTCKRELFDAKDELIVVKGERELLERRLQAVGMSGGDGAPSGDAAAVEQVTKVAQASIQRLQAQVAEAKGEVHRMQELVTKTRNDAIAQHSADTAEIQRLGDQLHEKTRETIAKLKHFDTPGAPAGPLDDSASKQTYKELCELLSEREHQLEVANNKLEQEQSKYGIMQARLEEQVRAKEAEMERMSSEVERERLRGPSKGMENLVAKLKAQVTTKDKKLGQLKEAVKQLEGKLIDLMKASAVDDMQAAHIKSTEAQAAAATALEAQVAELKDKAGRAREEAARCRAASEAKEAELERLTAELHRSEATAKQLSLDLTKERRAAHSLKARKEAAADTRRQVSSTEAERQVADLQKRVQVLQAQNQKLSKMLRAEGQEVRASLEGAPLGASEGGGAGGAAISRLQAEVAAKEGTIQRLRSQLERVAAEPARKPSVPRQGGGDGSAAAVARWEEDKRQQKRLELLKRKLDEKTNQVQLAEKQAQRAQDTIADLSKERAVLSQKVRALQAAVTKAEAGGPGGASAAGEARAEAQRLANELQRAEAEADRLRRETSVTQRRQIEALQRELEEARERAPAAGARGGRGAGGGEAGAEARVEVLEERCRVAESEALELRFEAEQGAIKVRRLEDRLKALGPGPGARGDPAPTRHSPDAAKVAELEDVVGALKKVVDKLQRDNEALKKSTLTSQQYMAAVNKAKDLRRQLDTALADVARLQQAEESHKGAQARLRAAEDQVQALRGKLRRDREAPPTRPHEPSSESEAEVEQLRGEVASKGRHVAALQRQLEEADAELERLQGTRAGGGGGVEEVRSQLEAVQRKLAMCQAENRDLKNELNAFDPAFFDEIEDLKHDHHELTQVCQQYERMLHQYSRELPHHPTFEPLSSRRRRP